MRASGVVGAALASVGLALCVPGTVGAQTLASPVRSCQLLKQSDAKGMFGTRTMSSEPTQKALPNAHSECLITPNGPNKANLVLDVSWGRKTLGVYRVAYGGHAVSVPVTIPTGGVTGTKIPVPHFSKLTVAGRTAYWVPNPPSVGQKDYPATYNANMISEKDGYVVAIHSNYVSERQDKVAMASVLDRL
jgi:hypothetical protein